MLPDIVAFCLFAFVSSVTPGPNNIMVAASSASHGMVTTVPAILGIALGFGAMLLVIGLGLAGPLAAHPQVHDALRWVGAAWMLWIAWGIARADPALRDGPRAPPIRFIGAALFQWVNPKAWVLAVVSVTTYTSPDRPLAPQVLLLAGVFVVMAFPCLLLWAAMGMGAGRVLRAPGQLRAFNLVMAALLVLSVAPMLTG